MAWPEEVGQQWNTCQDPLCTFLPSMSAPLPSQSIKGPTLALLRTVGVSSNFQSPQKHLLSPSELLFFLTVDTDASQRVEISDSKV